ncbi:PREDICTED: tRNA wybutosine-synthesizing protein 2 homolog [Nanorana parkeri]|uniref:tRNA wybutosine-synthesizing protein 2 homolog n=1 Tax=Nanorana parkeri TaxID=125878 RepID=UPI0008549111|nr:PREDICTED: tRNA wybutosine-synthesizing protein 2 homolog [Nanorana parkeri]
MELEEDRFPDVPALLTQCAFSQKYREYLQNAGILDGRYRAQKLEEGTVALPVLKEKITVSLLKELMEAVAPGSSCRETLIKNPVLSKRARVQSPAQKLRMDLCDLLEHQGIIWRRNLDHDLPHSWQRHGDLVVLSEDCFCDPVWKQLGKYWTRIMPTRVQVASSLGVKRVAKQSRVQDDGWRSPNVTLLLGDDGWVEHVDNGIRYSFDVTKCMFSAGNIVEKQRLSALCCAKETVVDLYAGIGYFTLPFLVHADAAFVHACEWNPHAVEALQKNLELNKVSHKCQVHKGDNREFMLEDVADRVNLGLIPTSEAGYPKACKVLKKNLGGVLHIHHNVNCFLGSRGLDAEEDTCCWRTLAWRKWAESAEIKIKAMLAEVHGTPWQTQILQVKKVKSYAPHVDHVVLDLDCRPLSGM